MERENEEREAQLCDSPSVNKAIFGSRHQKMAILRPTVKKEKSVKGVRSSTASSSAASSKEAEQRKNLTDVMGAACPTKVAATP